MLSVLKHILRSSLFPPIPLSNSTDIRLKRGSLRGSLILHMMQYTIYQLLNNTPKNKYCIINYLMFSICVGRVAIKGRGHKRSNWSYFPIFVYFIKQHIHWLLISLIISYYQSKLQQNFPPNIFHKKLWTVCEYSENSRWIRNIGDLVLISHVPAIVCFIQQIINLCASGCFRKLHHPLRASREQQMLANCDPGHLGWFPIAPIFSI